jgi:acetoacetate decarboxylase
MGFVRTVEEIKRIEDAFASARWSGEWLSVQFLTDPRTVDRLLPPPLAPASEPVATATIGRWQSNCLGDFAGGVLSISASYDGIEGAYVLALYLDREPPVVFGRDVFGEPKKLARSRLLHDAGVVHGWIERHGHRLIDLRARVGEDLGPRDYERCTYNYKARTATGGRGLEEDAILTRATFTVQVRTQRDGEGTISLQAGPHDPLDELEVVSVIGALYGEDESAVRCAAVATVPSETFLPYHYGRQDDWLVLAGAVGDPHAHAAAPLAG